MAGRAPEPQGSSRDLYMAETVRLLRKRFPGEKIVLMLHNGHLQRVPFSPMPGMRMPSAGTHLAAEYGDDYFALALTGGTGTTTGLTPDESAPLGFRVHAEDLGEPEPDSVEAALADAGECLVDLRTVRAKSDFRPQRIRHAHMYSTADVAEAFDALVYLPRIGVSEYVTRSGDIELPVGGAGGTTHA